jgi:hypothetical protein
VRAPSTAAPARRSLFPQEHGAYGQLFAPLLTALAIGRPSLSAAALALSAALGFFAYEPARVALGQRGSRVREEHGRRAGWLLLFLAAGAALSGAMGLALAPPVARWAALPALALAGGAALVVHRRLEMTMPGEVAIAVALSSIGLPVALAGGAPLSHALACWAIWAAAFVSAVVAVQVLLWRTRARGGRSPGPLAAAVPLGIAVAAWLLAARGTLPWAGPVALAPMTALSLALCLLPIAAQRLRQVGWTIMAASLATMLLLVLGLR